MVESMVVEGHAGCSGFFHKIQNDLTASVNANGTGIQAQVIILRNAPLAVGIILIVYFSFFIFRFLLLIFLSPPYKYIIPYGARYVNSFSKKYKGNKKKILLPSYLSSVFFSHHNHNIKSTEQNEHFQFF